MTSAQPLPFSHAGYKFTRLPEKRLLPSEKLEVLFQLVRRPVYSEHQAGERKLRIDYTIANINNGKQQWTYRDEVAIDRFDSNGSLLNSRTIPLHELHPGRYFLILTANGPEGHRTSQTVSFEVSGLERETANK
jgi:hypothetical protein